MRLDEFFERLDGFDERVPLDDLVEWMEALDLSVEDVDHVACFNDEHYQRNLLKAGSGYHALVLCWKAGQRSPIHDHRGSSCGVRVLAGALTETIFERTPGGHLVPARTHELLQGAVCGSQDSDVHQISNLSDASPLITLHIYSPPLLSMGLYSLTNPRVETFVDPVVGLCDGAGI